jgi:hypothetical protein
MFEGVDETVNSIYNLINSSPFTGYSPELRAQEVVELIQHRSNLSVKKGKEVSDLQLFRLSQTRPHLKKVGTDPSHIVCLFK